MFQSRGARVAAIINPRLLPIGLLGFFESDDDEDSARTVLHDGARWLREQGAQVVRGPMAYATWNDYRFVVERTEPGSFRGEPDHPDFYPRLWERAGFTRVSTYASHWIDMNAAQARWTDKVARARDAGVTVRAVTDADFPSIYQLALAAFADAYMFSPIDPDEFVSIYGGDRPADSRTTIAHLDGRPVGFMHTFVADLPRGRTGIAKTVAVHPDARDRGVYHALFSDALTSFQSAGLSHAIAALMHLDGSPALMGWARGPLYKQYALYQLT
jgi:GNAT superfamily N-acetyltransferase